MAYYKGVILEKISRIAYMQSPPIRHCEIATIDSRFKAVIIFLGCTTNIKYTNTIIKVQF